MSTGVYGTLLTELCNLRQFSSLRLIQYLTIIPFACHIHAKDDGLINHLVKMNGGTDILRYLGFRIDQQIPCNVHQLY